MPSLDEFEIYARGLMRLGHDRLWIMHNEAELRRRFAADPKPFPCPPDPVRVASDRYEEL